MLQAGGQTYGQVHEAPQGCPVRKQWSPPGQRRCEVHVCQTRLYLMSLSLSPLRKMGMPSVEVRENPTEPGRARALWIYVTQFGTCSLVSHISQLGFPPNKE